MGIGSTEILMIRAIGMVPFGGLPRLDLFAYAYKYGSPRSKVQSSPPDRIDLILVATLVLIPVAAVVLAFVMTAT